MLVSPKKEKQTFGDSNVVISDAQKTLAVRFKLTWRFSMCFVSSLRSVG